MAEINEIDAIKVAIDVAEGIMVEANGSPAKIVAYGAAAGIVFVSVAVGCTAYNVGCSACTGVKNLWNRLTQ